MTNKHIPPNSEESTKASAVEGELQAASNDRRQAVQKILAGGGLTIGAVATSSQWVKPVVESVVLPAHAQTSDMAVMMGNANLSATVQRVEKDNSNSVLDFFIGPAHALVGPTAPVDLGGACITLTVSGGTFDVDISFFSGSPITFSGAVSNNSISGSGSGITITGTVDLLSVVPTASGTVSNSLGMYGYSLSSGTTNCQPMAPTTTTVAPTTTSSTTTASPTTTVRAS